MPIMWPDLQSKTKDYLEDLSEKTLDDTAKFFADSYVEAAGDGTDVMQNGIVAAKPAAPIEAAWKTALNLQFQSDTPLGPSNWLPVELAIMAWWMGTVFKFSTPHPPGATGMTNVVTMGGGPGISSQIDIAFKQEKAALVATILVAGYQTHIMTVLGLWSGLLPPAASSPVAVPWVGVL